MTIFELITVANLFLTLTLLYFQFKSPPQLALPDEKWIYFKLQRHSSYYAFATPDENAVLPPKDYKFASAWQVDHSGLLTCTYKRLIRRKDPLELYDELTHGSQ